MDAALRENARYKPTGLSTAAVDIEQRVSPQPGRRKSSVNGNSLLAATSTVACCTRIAPGVCPIRKNRASLLLSASYELTGNVA
jgi:hypothetical protein